MGETVSYKCPSCGAPLVYDAEENKFKCDFCVSTFEITEIKQALDEEGDKGFDWGDYKKNYSDEKIEGTVSYICQSCGAEIVTDAVTAATKCPYCDNVIVVEPNLSGTIKPNAIIPFKIDKKGLVDAVKNYCKGKKLLPKNFLSENKIKEVQGVYVPFWLFDCHADGNMSFEGTRVRHWSDKNYEYTETSHYLLDRAGNMDFKMIPVDGSIKMDDALMDSIEPFNYNEMVEFEPGYLSGFLADRFDADADESLPRATSRVKNSVSEMFSSTTVGYASVMPISSNIELSNTEVNYVLLPVYLIKSKYAGKEYTFAVNGQTGKVTGNLPYSKAKFFSVLFGIAGAIGIIGGTLFGFFG